MFKWTALHGRSRPVPASADLVHIKDVRIASPCTSDWAQMAGDDRVRHCAECNLNVYNFAAMTGFEIAELLANRQGRRVCARIYRRADGTMITQDCPKGLRAVIRRVSRVAGAAFVAAMSLNFAVAQTPASSQTSAPQQQKEGENPPTGEIAFTVVDPQGAVIPGVEVVLMEKKEAGGKKDKKTETVIQLKATTDSAGSVRFAGLRPGLYEVKAISKYFKTYKKEMTVKDHSAEQLKLVIDPSTVESVTVGVIAEEAPIDTSSSQVIHMMSLDRQIDPSSPVQFPQRGPAVPMRQ